MSNVWGSPHTAEDGEQLYRVLDKELALGILETGSRTAIGLESCGKYIILDTEKYAQDCERVFGYFLHHFPYFGMRGEEDAAKLAASAGETKGLFEQEFSSILPEVAVNTCSGSWCSSTFSELSQAAREELRVDWRPSLTPKL